MLVDRSGEAEMRPWSERCPLAGWGILLGLREWDLSSRSEALTARSELLEIMAAEESEGDQQPDTLLTDDAPEKTLEPIFTAGCKVCGFLVFFYFYVRKNIQTWCCGSDMVKKLAVLCVQTSAVPHSLKGAEAGPQRCPRPVWWCGCRRHKVHTQIHKHKCIIPIHMLCVPWFCFSSLNWMTCWCSLASFGLWQPWLATVGEWRGEELSDERPGCQQEEEHILVLSDAEVITRFNSGVKTRQKHYWWIRASRPGRCGNIGLS